TAPADCENFASSGMAAATTPVANKTSTASDRPMRWGVLCSRVAERRLNATVWCDRSAVAPRRRIVCLAAFRGLKPTATIVVSLRETGEDRFREPFILTGL